MGGASLSSASGPSAPPELQPLIPLQQAITKAASTLSSGQEATADYEKLMYPATEPPSAPVLAARLSALLKKLASAEGAVVESIKARRDLIAGLEKLLATNREALEKEESQHGDLTSRKDAVDSKKRAVEDEILRKLPSESPGQAGVNGENGEELTNGQHELSVEPERPQMEELTPPPPPPPQSPIEPADEFEPAEPGEENFGAFRGGTPTPPAGYDFPVDSSNHEVVEPSSKKRKLTGGFGGFMDDSSRDLEEDVDDLIRAEGGG